MNPGVSEEASKVAVGVTEALKSTPAILAIVIFNVLFMGLIAWATHEQGQRWERLTIKALEVCPVKAQ